MKRIILALLPCLLLFSCVKPSSVRDLSFQISSRAVFDENEMKSTLHLSLDKGCPENSYTLNCTIDDDPSLSFSEVIPFGDDMKASILLPDLEIGSHELALEYSTDVYRQKGICKLEVTVGNFAVHAEVNTESVSRSTLMVSLVQGRPTEAYSVSAKIKGTTIAEMDGIDFRKTPIASLPLPVQRPGSYDLDVIASDGRTSVSSKVSYKEPLRHPELNMEIARSLSTGKTRFRVTSNPYGLSVAVYDSLVVKGRCDYHVCSVYEDRVDYKTAYKEACDIAELTRFVPVIGTWYNLTDTQTKEDIITSQFMSNSKWSGSWSNTGEGGFEYTQVDDGVSFFKIVSSTHHMKLAFEVIDGITVNVSNSERDVVLNGTVIPSGRYSYKLK